MNYSHVNEICAPGPRPDPRASAIVLIGEDAVRVLQKHEVGVIVTDLKMPRVDGAELLKIAKTDEKKK